MSLNLSVRKRKQLVKDYLNGKKRKDDIYASEIFKTTYCNFCLDLKKTTFNNHSTEECRLLQKQNSSKKVNLCQKEVDFVKSSKYDYLIFKLNENEIQIYDFITFYLNKIETREEVQSDGFCLIKFPDSWLKSNELSETDFKKFKIPEFVKQTPKSVSDDLFTIKSVKKAFNKSIKDFFELKSSKTKSKSLEVYLDKKTTVNYALNIPGSLMKNQYFNLSDIQNNDQNMIYNLPSNQNWSGILTPSIYCGTMCSNFPIHKEDGDLGSVNILLYGKTKVWYIFSPKDHIKIKDLINKNYKTDCSDITRHKTCFLKKEFFTKNNIKYKKVKQRVGDMVVLLPRAYHIGYNKGNNIAEACNFGTSSWYEQVFDEQNSIIYCTCGHNTNIVFEKQWFEE